MSVSVVIPTFDSGSTIERALKSILMQTAQPLEVIVIDDGSTIEQGSMVHSYWSTLKTDTPLKVIRLDQNYGPAHARNVGWDAAEADFVAFLDADDAWHPQKLEVQYLLHQEYPNCKLSGHEFIVLPPDRWENNDYRSAASKVITYNDLLLRNRFPTPSIMIRRCVKHRFPEDQRRSEDYFLWLLVASDQELCLRLSAPLCALYKPAFGASGLSRNIFKTQYSETQNYIRLYKQNRLSGLALTGTICFSLLRFGLKLIRLATAPLRGRL